MCGCDPYNRLQWCGRDDCGRRYHSMVINTPNGPIPVITDDTMIPGHYRFVPQKPIKFPSTDNPHLGDAFRYITLNSRRFGKSAFYDGIEFVEKPIEEKKCKQHPGHCYTYGMTVKCVENGFLIEKEEILGAKKQLVFKTFEDVVTYLAHRFDLIKIGEKVKLSVGSEHE